MYRIVKALGIFAGIVVVGLALIVGGLRLTDHAARGNPVAAAPVARAPLTHTQFVRAGNAVCARYYRVDAPLAKKPPKTLKMVTRYLRVEVPAIDRETAGLRALLPPRDDVGAYRRLLRGVGQVDRDAHAILHAFETGQFRRGVLIARRIPSFNRRLNPLARKLGLAVCGLTGRQEQARYG
jgi:hypothetical protein